MKSERRHELDKNDLADRLAKGIETVKPYQNAIIAGILLILVAFLSYGWWVRKSTTASEAGWDSFYEALAKLGGGQGGFDDAMSDFDDIIQKHPKTYLAHWTAAVAGDLRLQRGCNQLFINKHNADQELKQATEMYEMLRSETRIPRLQQRAIFGLARATEARLAHATGAKDADLAKAKEDLDKAKELYKELSQKWPEGVYAAQATRRAEDLVKVTTWEMYADFAKFDPKPAYLNEPGIPGDRPTFDLDSLTAPPSGGTLSDGSLSNGPDSFGEGVFSTPLMDIYDAGDTDSGDSDSGGSDSGGSDSGDSDSGDSDSGDADTGDADAGDGAEPPVTDDGPTDAGTADESSDASPDTAATDSPETATPETATPETATPETATPETATPDTADSEPDTMTGAADSEETPE